MLYNIYKIDKQVKSINNNMNTLVKQQESSNGQYRISVYYDLEPSCPCTDWDMGAAFLFTDEDDKYLHDKCNWAEIYNKDYYDNMHTMEEALRELVYQYIPQNKVVKFLKDNEVDGWRLYYDQSSHLWKLQSYWHNEWCDENDFTPNELNGVDCVYELTEFMEQTDLISMLQKYGQDIVVKDFTLRGYCQGDFIEGVAFTTKERYSKFCNKDTKNWKKKTDEIINANMECVNRWMWGDVYGYVLEKKRNFTKTYEDGEEIDDCEWVETDSCWGFFCDPDEVIEENLPND